jgi:hypothetical protein
MTEALGKLEAAAESLRGLPPDEETADYLGRLDYVIRKLTDHKRSILAELPAAVTGDNYQVAETRSATRSYNTAAILSAFTEAGWDLHDLRKRDAVRLTWRWTELRAAYNEAGATMKLAPREIEDDGDIDGAHIGEFWKSSMSIKAVEK